MAEQTEVAALEKAGAGAKANGSGPPRVAAIPPSVQQAREPFLSVQIAPPLESDGTLPLRVASDAIGACRDAWTGMALLHEGLMNKVSPLLPEVGQQLKSRGLAYEQQQRALKRCDAALAEIRTEVKLVEAQLTKKALPTRAREDAAGVIADAEVRLWIHSHASQERLSVVEKAIAAGDAPLVVVALERPLIAGLSAEVAALLRDRWQRARAPEEIARLALLEQTAGRVRAAGEALQRRYRESFDHVELDAIERQHRPAASAKAAA